MLTRWLFFISIKLCCTWWNFVLQTPLFTTFQGKGKLQPSDQVCINEASSSNLRSGRFKGRVINFQFVVLLVHSPLPSPFPSVFHFDPLTVSWWETKKKLARVSSSSCWANCLSVCLIHGTSNKPFESWQWFAWSLWKHFATFDFGLPQDRHGVILFSAEFFSVFLFTTY